MDSLIEKYFNNSLSKEEQKSLDSKLQTDADFKAEFEFEKDLKTALIDKKKDALKKTFATIEKESINPETANYIPEKFTTNNFLKYAIAAALIAVLAVAGYFSLQGGSLSNQEIFAANFEPYRNIIAPITRGETDLTEIEKAFSFYENQKYTAAINAFQEQYTTTRKNYYLFYIGNTQLAMGDTSKAIKTLERHLKTRDKFTEKSKWYLALAYLQNNKQEQAKLLLTEISKTKAYKATEATIILAELD